MDNPLLPTLAAFYTGDETLHLFFATLVLGLVLLPAGGDGRTVVRQTLVFSVLCLLGNLGAALLAASGAARPAAVLHGILLLGLGIGVIRLVGLLVFRVLLPRLHIAPPRILEDIVVIIGYVAWGLIRLSQSGVELSSIVTTSAVITAVIAFSMQDTLGNILGGLALQLDSSIQIGDWVKIDDVSGQVTDIRWRYTAIRTRNGETVVVPNSLLMKGKVWVIGDREQGTRLWRRTLHFNVGYVAQPARVVATVELAVREANIPNVSRERPVSCVLMEFGPGYGHYALRYWMDDPAPDDPTDSAVRSHIYAALRRSGWRLALPEEMRYLVKDNAALRSATKSRELQHRIDALRSVSLFAQLTDEECGRVAEHLVYAPFAAGDVLTRQGAIAHWLYIILAGEAEVVRRNGDGEEHALARLKPGDFFGEMGLLTGEPRTASVHAVTDVECYRLDKTGLAEIMADRPAIAEELSAVLAARSQQNEAASTGGDPRRKAPPAGLGGAIVGRIRSFFNLE
ncbi:MAG: mechanosensitive ion channel [Azonexus sp.]|nr:mechanosensitive ion channel [Betaproteobacteria bacterium]MBK8918032.1 mechanosensitive ion channel [Betaproteobacteria bacterium]MBP6036777.1 mechanosensitive ion channel [Azonexus sp.]MBP6907326.1 mechanosensitive ion channel [Azonexus sp.]